MTEEKSDLAHELAALPGAPDSHPHSLHMLHARRRGRQGYEEEVQEALRLELEPPLNLYTMQVVGQYLAHILAYHPQEAKFYEEERVLYLQEILGVYSSADNLMAVAGCLITQEDVEISLDGIDDLARVPGAIDHESTILNRLFLIREKMLWEFEIWKLTLPTLNREPHKLLERIFSFVQDPRLSQNSQILQFKLKMIDSLFA